MSTILNRISSRRVVFFFMVAFGLFHLSTLSQSPPVEILEGWYVSPAYTYHRHGTLDDTMFPGLIEYQNGSWGQGKLRYFLQALSFDLIGFGLYQARFPMLLGGFISIYLVYLISRHLWGIKTGLWASIMYMCSPMSLEMHLSQSHAWLVTCFLLSVYFFLICLSKGRLIFALFSGVIIGIGISFHFMGSLGVIALTFAVLYCRFKKEIANAEVVAYLGGGIISFLIWYILEIAPIGIDAFARNMSYRSQVVQSHYLGWHWVDYFLSRRGAIIELPLMLGALVSARQFWQESRERFFFLCCVGLCAAYSWPIGSGSIIIVWAPLFMLAAALTYKLVNNQSGRFFLSRVWFGILLLVLVYYVAFQAKSAYGAYKIKPGNQYREVISKISNDIPEGKTIMGSPLYWFGLVGRNLYITQNFYWERMDKQTHELGIDENPPAEVRTQRMIAFMKRRNVEYLIADPYFREALNPWIPEAKWAGVFSVVSEMSSPIYGSPSAGGRPPYRIQVWRLKEDITL